MGSTTINASCLCKGIQFTVTGQSKGAVLCHCSNCKSFHGSAFAHNYRMMKTKVEYKQGKELLRSYKDDATKSGKVLERFFCSKCGSSLMNVPEAVPGLVVVCAGAIEGDVPTKPKFELFEEDRRAWMNKVNDAKL